MILRVVYFAFIIMLTIGNTLVCAQNKSHYYQTPVWEHNIIFGTNHFGYQNAIGYENKFITKHKIKFNSTEKLILKHRNRLVSLGFYIQPQLHTNILLSYHFQNIRDYKRGWYREFSPQLGISRTFLNQATYVVNSNGEVSQKHFAGDWRLMGGFNWGLGKQLKIKSDPKAMNVYLRLNTMIFYPNFRFVSIKPSLVIGGSFYLKSHPHRLTATHIYKNPWHRKLK